MIRKFVLVKKHLSKNNLICCSCGKKHSTILHIKNSIPDGTTGNMTIFLVAKKDTISGTDTNSIILGVTSTVQTGASTMDHNLRLCM